MNTYEVLYKNTVNPVDQPSIIYTSETDVTAIDAAYNMLVSGYKVDFVFKIELFPNMPHKRTIIHGF